MPGDVAGGGEDVSERGGSGGGWTEEAANLRCHCSFDRLGSLLIK